MTSLPSVARVQSLHLCLRSIWISTITHLKLVKEQIGHSSKNSLMTKLEIFLIVLKINIRPKEWNILSQERKNVATQVWIYWRSKVQVTQSNIQSLISVCFNWYLMFNISQISMMWVRSILSYINIWKQCRWRITHCNIRKFKIKNNTLLCRIPSKNMSWLLKDNKLK